MDSPGSESTATTTTRIVARTSVMDSLKGCSLGGVKISKEELRQRITMPEYLRLAIRDAVAAKDVDAGKSHYDATLASTSGGSQPLVAPECPVVVFVNSKSGGRHGPELKARLQELMGEEQVCDLHTVKPNDFIQYGLGCLEKFAGLGDHCAKESRERLRVVVAGGDGTVGWVLGCLGDLPRQGREPVPPTAIIPLGTGNDLSRSFGWGGSFPFNWKQAVKKTLDRASNGPICRLDRDTKHHPVADIRSLNAVAQLASRNGDVTSWNLTIAMPAGGKLDPPHSLKPTEDVSLDQGLEVEGLLPEKVSCYNGVFYNYFSIGMDAQVAYGFHHLRNEKPYLAQGPVSNKIIYSGYSCKQGWFFTPCINDPSLRGLKNILRLHVKRVNSTVWEVVTIPSSVRSIVALNLHSYASGRNPWGNLKPEYLEKKGFVEAHADDGILEVFGFKQGWHASFVMVDLISAKHIAQAQSIRFEVRGGAWKEAFMQMDGEPWKQPMNTEYSTFVEITRVPFQSVMVNGDF